MRGPAGSLAMALLLLAALPPAVAAAPLSAQFLAQEIAFDGATITGDAIFFGALQPGSEGPGASASFHLTAAAMDVVTTREPYQRTTGPLALDVGGLTQGDLTTDDPVHHKNVTATSLRTGFTAFVQAEGVHGPGGAPTFEAESTVQRVQPRARLDFQRDVPGNTVWEPERHGPWPNLEATARTHDAVVLRGTLVLSFYDLDLQVQADDGNHTYRTGEVRTDSAPGGDAPALLVEGERRRIDATLHDAVLTYLPAGLPFQVNVRSATLGGDGLVRFMDATGSLRAQEDVVLDHADLLLDGRWTALIAHDPAGIQTTLTAHTVRSASLGGVPLALVAPEPLLARTRWARITPLALLVLALAAGLGWRARARRLDPDTLVVAAGWALESGRPRTAAGWARKALAQDATDRDAALMHTVSLYRRDRHAEGVAWLGAWMKAHGSDAELEMTMGLGVLQTHGPQQAAAWVGRALDADPSLGRLLPGNAHA